MVPGTFPFSFVIPHQLDPWNLYQHDLPVIAKRKVLIISGARMALAYTSTRKGLPCGDMMVAFSISLSIFQPFGSRGSALPLQPGC